MPGKKVPDTLLYAVLASLTLGLAPFTPEPHIVGKIRWIAGGAHGMQFIDWFDVVLHGAPWVWLMVVLLKWLLPSRKAAAQ